MKGGNVFKTDSEKRKPLLLGSTVSLLTLLAGCAADIGSIPRTGPGTKPPTVKVDGVPFEGAYFSFQHSNFYSLASPNPSTSCAGDLKSFFDPYLLDTSSSNSKALKLPQNPIIPSTTQQPSFIKNISVDLTDSNSALSSNASLACSLGTGSNAPSPSNCSTFDYGAIGGIYSGFGNSLLMVGGTPQSTTSKNSTNFFALALNSSVGVNNQNTFSSSWLNIGAATNTSAPKNPAGASLSYDGVLNKLILFGGGSPLSALGPSASAITTSDTWTFDLKTQKWQLSNPGTFVDVNMTLTYAQNQNGEFVYLNKPAGGRTLFGYTAVSGMALSRLSLTGNMTGAGGATIDLTDRILTIGGYGSCVYGFCTDTHKFNPTYAPEYFDAANPKNPASFPVSPRVQQWVDSYHHQILNNSQNTGFLLPTQFPTPSPVPTPTPSIIAKAAGFGVVPLNNNYPSSSGMGVSNLINGGLPTPSTKTIPGAGYVASAGGFYGISGYFMNRLGGMNQLGDTCSSINQCGDLSIFFKWFGTGWDSTAETSASNFTHVTNLIDNGLLETTPGQWVHIKDGAAANQKTPWFGGAVLLKGINIDVPAGFTAPGPALPLGTDPSALNEVVYFGGADCSNYLTSSTSFAQDCPNWPNPGNEGRYWIFGLDPASAFNPTVFPTVTFGRSTFNSPTSTNSPLVVSMSGAVPKNAGMAADRGMDAMNHPLIVAWGGLTGPGMFDTTGAIYYLYNNNGTPTWGSMIPSGLSPAPLANASLIYSHVTGKFYLFGGFTQNSITLGETWELSLHAASGSCATSGNCQFTWRQLSTGNGMTCYPSCPPARRSHRMVEANYNYFNAPYDPVCTSKELPCSFGIFMEGGTADGISAFTDRWMFDPTANSNSSTNTSNGHWQLVNDFPPRTLASMASVQYIPVGKTAPVHRMILFGGETGMQNPNLQSPTQHFVAPTLGDTWMYDFNLNSWNQVYLFGARYNNQATINSISNEVQIRSASTTADISTQVFSPPPTSGGIMVTRTLSRATHSLSDTPKSLKIPEIFFFGGRQKDGTYNLINTVYKFCAGSTGEKPTSLRGVALPGPDDASCDAYDSATNPDSPSPASNFVGRWLVKSPLIDSLASNYVGSSMGAGTYDSDRDLILLFGGLTPNSNATIAAVTDTNNYGSISSYIFEYTPPSALAGGVSSSAFNGSWDSIEACSGSSVPPDSYGHSMSYDSTRKSVFIVGGYRQNGTALNHIETMNGLNYTVPDVWVATREDSNTPCYRWSKISLSSDSIQLSVSNSGIPTAISNSAISFIPTSGYNTGYYTLQDRACVNSGPISSTDTEINKLLAGGVYFDIHRNQLGTDENLILNLTYMPLGPKSLGPNQKLLSKQDSPIFKIHLIKTGQSGDTIRSLVQPRFLTYSATDQYPITAQNISVLNPNSSYIQQEQILIPLSMDAGIDRIRIERYSGSAILIDASLFRLGAPPQGY